MITVRLMGGLGNQMFQYAAGKALSVRLGVPLLLDRSFLDYKGKNEGYTLRNYELDVFQIDAQIASRSEVAKMRRPIESELFKFLSQNFSSFFKDHTFSESENKSIKEFERLQSPVYLNGYWQEEDYFKEIAELLKQKEFIPVAPFSGLNEELLKQIINSNSVSLHVRRSDYVSVASTNKYHGTCSVEYYQQAAQLVADKKGANHFFVFSDDIEWTKKNIQLPFPCTFISHNHGRDSYWDLMLMKSCRNHIIANSSFSWWGAWLNDNQEKMVIAPKVWFKDEKAASLHHLPCDWIRL